MKPCAVTLALILLTTQSQFSRTFGQSEMRPSPPGKLVNVGAHRLHLYCVGKGSPTVVLEAGAGDFSFDWGLVQPRIAELTRICAYDRAGYGWSDPGPMPRTLHQIAGELSLLLRKSKEKGPYVLVGQSLGGLIVRVFAGQHAKDVAGIILVDSSHEDNQIMLNDKMILLRDMSRGREVPPVQLKMPKSHKSNSSDQPIPDSAIQPPYDKLPPHLQQARLWAINQRAYVDARRSEFDFLPEELALIHKSRSQQHYPLGDIPLIVLTRGNHSNSAHQQLQADLARLSRNSRHITVEKSEHHIQLDQPDAVVTAIRDMVNAYRGRKH